MVKYNFDTVYSRPDSEKWMEQRRKFGVDGLVSLWEADMDFQSPEPVVQALVDRAKTGIYGYVHKPETYNHAIIEWISRRHGWTPQTEWLLHSPMLMTAVLLYLKRFCAPEDKVVFQTPIYYPFYDVVKYAGREALFNPLIHNEKTCRYNMDFDNLEQQFQKGGKVFILCTPHNPAGMVWTREELLHLGQLCQKYDVRVIADEAHADFTFHGHTYTPFASLGEDFRHRSMTLLSPGKTFNLAGTHQAVIIIPDPETRAEMGKQIGMLDIEKNNCFSLVAVEAGYRGGEDWLRQAMAYIETNMEYVIHFCREQIPEIKAVKPEGTYLMWLDCRGFGFSSGDELGKFMTHRAHVGLCEGYWFGEQGAGFERLNVACPRSVLAQAMEQIANAAEELRRRK